MTITEQTTGTSIYTVLERVPEVQPDPVIAACIEEMTQIHVSASASIRRAREALIHHEEAAKAVLDDIQTALPQANELDDGLFELLSILSGAQRLHYVMSCLSDFCSPDSRFIDESTADIHRTD